jgi:hypothetical protein
LLPTATQIDSSGAHTMSSQKSVDGAVVVAHLFGAGERPIRGVNWPYDARGTIGETRALAGIGVPRNSISNPRAPS